MPGQAGYHRLDPDRASAGEDSNENDNENESRNPQVKRASDRRNHFWTSFVCDHRLVTGIVLRVCQSELCSKAGEETKLTRWTAITALKSCMTSDAPVEQLQGHIKGASVLRFGNP